MDELFLVRTFTYSLLPLLLAGGHILIDRNAQTPTRCIELLIMYLLAINVGASGLGGAFAHIFLSDLVAEGVGWPTGNPFQLEVGFANLMLGIMGLIAVGRRDGFRTATILAATVFGVGATAVHLWDIYLTSNLAPGNTLQNISNLLDPILLIALTWLANHTTDPDAETAAFHQWRMQQQPILGWLAAGIGTGFGIGFALNSLLLWLGIGVLTGIAIGIIIRNLMVSKPHSPIMEGK